jgi:hypothetical protein
MLATAAIIFQSSSSPPTWDLLTATSFFMHSQHLQQSTLQVNPHSSFEDLFLLGWGRSLDRAGLGDLRLGRTGLGHRLLLGLLSGKNNEGGAGGTDIDRGHKGRSRGDQESEKNGDTHVEILIWLL